jgi:hypothetical protein
MIHVQPQPELAKYWVKCLDDLHEADNGICADLAVHIELVTGAATVDHFAPQSLSPGLAYEWHNDRLACLMMNSRKRQHLDVLNPFDVENGWFQLNFVNGEIFPNPALSPQLQQQVRDTMERLNPDSPGNRAMRVRHSMDYTNNLYPSDHLKRYSPFVWMEANRQGLL